MAREITRRTVLRGLGTAMALPALDAMVPRGAFANGDAAKPPMRLAVMFFPNGVNVSKWTPRETGASYSLPPTLEPLQNVKDEINVFTGLTHDKARANGDGAGDHARSAATFLTGSQAKKTDGKEIRAGISLDQLIAEKVGQTTRLPSLEIGCDKGAMAGNCDSGYSCAYSSTIVWKSPTQPIPKEVNPRLIFERLFGDPNKVAEERDRAKALLYKKSVLDLVLEDAKKLNGDLGGADRRKVEEYLDSVRSIEKQIQAAERDTERRLPPELEVPDGVPGEFPKYVRLMVDLLVAALQTQTTRVATFMLANEGSNRTFPFIDVRDGHHSISHHAGNQEKLEKIAKIDRFYVGQFAYLVEKLRSIKEGDGTLLDSTMALYGNSIGDGNRHNHDELPVLFAGKAQGTVQTGRHVRYPRNTPLANLYLSILDRMGVKEEKFGDSTGRLTDLA
ncbi:MAG TPA: DUF1552 domain-containing protein [Planctomycetota bacterium]|nr:DUF1552 domain-containing protein [Planctomycetota bacterium]